MDSLKTINAQIRLRDSTIGRLLKRVQPPWWMPWVGEEERAAAAHVLGEKGGASREVLDVLLSVMRRDKSTGVREYAADSVGIIASMPQIPDECVIEVKTVLDDTLQKCTSADFACSLLRALGRLGQRARDREGSIRRFMEGKLEQPAWQSRGLMLWCAFALARTSAEPSGPLEAIRRMLNATREEEVTQKLTELLGSMPPSTPVFGLLAAGSAPASLVNKLAASPLLGQLTAGNVPASLVNLMASARLADEKRSVLYAIELLGRVGAPLREDVLALRASNLGSSLEKNINETLEALSASEDDRGETSLTQGMPQPVAAPTPAVQATVPPPSDVIADLLSIQQRISEIARQHPTKADLGRPGASTAKDQIPILCANLRDAVRAMQTGLDSKNRPVTRADIAAGLGRLIAHTSQQEWRGMVALALDIDHYREFLSELERLNDLPERIVS